MRRLTLLIILVFGGSLHAQAEGDAPVDTDEVIDARIVSVVAGGKFMPDESTDVAVIVRNDGRDDRNFVVVATLPEGWESDCTNDDLQDDIPTGTSREFVFEITPPEEGGEGRITWTLYWDVPAANDNTPIEYIDVPKNYGKGIVHQWVSTHETPERTMWLYRISALPTGVDAKAVEEVAVPEQAGSKVPLILLRGLEKEAALDADKRDAAREVIDYWHDPDDGRQDFLEYWFGESAAPLRERYQLYAVTYFTNDRIDTNAAALAKTLTGCGLSNAKGAIVAHSLGGLVARSALKRHGLQASKIFTLGTPHRGAAFTINEAKRAIAEARGTNLEAPALRDMQWDSHFLADAKTGLNRDCASEPVIAFAGGPFSVGVESIGLHIADILGTVPDDVASFTDGVVPFVSALNIPNAAESAREFSPLESAFPSTCAMGRHFIFYNHEDLKKGRSNPEPIWNEIALILKRDVNDGEVWKKESAQESLTIHGNSVTWNGPIYSETQPLGREKIATIISVRTISLVAGVIIGLAALAYFTIKLRRARRS